jgi:membrane protein CcdC involved in cytochrome C biogenesis
MDALPIAAAVIGASAVLVWRMRESSRPVTLKKIVIPPIGMSTGFVMFAYPPARVPLSWAAVALLVGALVLSYPLVKTTTLVRQGEAIAMQRSKAFIVILLGLFAIRLAARAYVEQYVNPIQTGSLFFLLAFGMIVRWRAWMFAEFKKLAATPQPAASPPTT